MKTILIKKTEETRGQDGHQNPMGLWSSLAFICLASGILSPVLGMLSIILHAAVEGDAVFGEVGTVLMIVSIPLLLAGSHFLDVRDKHRREHQGDRGA